MNTPDTLSVLRARLSELSRHHARQLAEIAGMLRLIDDLEVAARADGVASPTVGRGTYRGTSGAYDPAKVVRLGGGDGPIGRGDRRGDD